MNVIDGDELIKSKQDTLVKAIQKKQVMMQTQETDDLDTNMQAG